jgi:hypothetical protein
MFGNECCLSTGEVIKITGLKIKKMMAEICEGAIGGCESQKPFELPMNFPGISIASTSQNTEIMIAFLMNIIVVISLCCFKNQKSQLFDFST